VQIYYSQTGGKHADKSIKIKVNKIVFFEQLNRLITLHLVTAVKRNLAA